MARLSSSKPGDRPIRFGFGCKLIPAVILVSALAGCATRNAQTNPPTVRPGFSTSSTSANQNQETDDEAQSVITTDSSNGIRYALPSEAQSQGTLELQSLGRTELHRHRKETSQLPALHVRLTLKNDTSPLNWTLDSRLQQLKIPGRTAQRPAFVRAKGESLPFIEVTPGETQVVDLYYVLPADARKDGDIPSYSIDWQVNTGLALHTNETTFETLAQNAITAPVFPFDGLIPKDPFEADRDEEDRGPAAVPNRPMPQFGIESDWWMDPFADLPPTWRDFVH